MGEYKEFFYSWNKNCRTSDIWDDITLPNDIGGTFTILQRMKVEPELAKEIRTYIEKNNIYLATMSVTAKDKEENLNFLCFIGADGIPISDLTCINKQNNIYKYEVKGKIGEVDKKREELQQQLDKRANEREKNKTNLIENFFKMSGLPMKEEEKRLESKLKGSNYGEDDDEIII